MVAEICGIYGWDYFTYINQPHGFIKTVIEKLTIERKKEQSEKARASRKL